MNRTGGSIGQQFSLIADGFYNTYAEIAAGRRNTEPYNLETSVSVISTETVLSMITT